jgi:HD-GYP domain-containing protein (c-di-GMP phosphodiesterase class II)
VARHAHNLSDVAGCSDREQYHIRIGCLLHDIGKQFIPNSILEKEGRLSHLEFSQIQQHPWLGYAYLNPFVSDSTILNTVLYHHERWNGTGYPYGMEGDQIPLGARICALADVWDALISNRCYRGAWSMTQAADFIWAGAGSQFDPHLTLQFLTMIEEEYSQPNGTTKKDIPALPMAGRNAPALEGVSVLDLREGMSVI